MPKTSLFNASYMRVPPTDNPPIDKSTRPSLVWVPEQVLGGALNTSGAPQGANRDLLAPLAATGGWVATLELAGTSAISIFFGMPALALSSPQPLPWSTNAAGPSGILIRVAGISEIRSAIFF